MDKKILSIKKLQDDLASGMFDCLQPQYKNSLIHYINDYDELRRSEKESKLIKSKILNVLRNKVAVPHMQLNKLLTQVSEMKIKEVSYADAQTTNYTIDDVEGILDTVLNLIRNAIDEITL